MASITPIRDPKNDHLLTPDNAALILIDYQATQVNSIGSMKRHELVRNVVTVTEAAKNYGMPIVLSTVNGDKGRTIKPLRDVIPDVPEIDRTSINSWEDKEFQDAVKATGRKKLIILGLWTEACLSFPVLDLLKEGYEIYTICDAVGGTSTYAHEMALQRMIQAGLRPSSVAQFLCEMQRDWARTETVPYMVKGLSNIGAFVSL